MGRRTSFNGGQWTKARFNSFVKSTLRSATRKWGPINEVKKKARVSRGMYACNGCKQLVPTTLPSPPGAKRKRTQNVFVDHIAPIIDPKKGFTTWDDAINRMFCEEDNLQLLCKECHDKKTQIEREIARKVKECSKK